METVKVDTRLDRLYRDGERYEISAAGLRDFSQSDLNRRLIEHFTHMPARALQSKWGKALLYHVIMMERPERALEIGTYQAGTAGLIGRALWEAGRGHLETIDPFGAERCPASIAELPPEVQQRITFQAISSADYFSRAMSSAAWFDFVLVDGDHEYEFARFDLDCAARFIRPNGIVILDNIDQPGPRLATRHFLQSHPEWTEVGGVMDQDDPGAPLAMPVPSVPDTILYVLRAPPYYVVRGEPRSFGPIASDSAAVDGIEVEIAAPAHGTLHVQVISRTFGGFYPEELFGQLKVEVDFGEADVGKPLRIPLEKPLRTELRGDHMHHRVEVVLAFTGGGMLGLKQRPTTYPARAL